MKQYIIAVILICSAAAANAQDLNKDISTAKSAYQSNKLEDAHFALQQAIAEVDILTGKKVLQLLPPTMASMAANTKDDNVFANSGFIGATIHRTWGQGTQTADLDIIDNSPLIGTLSTLLNTPFIGGMMNSDKSKTVKVQGYKARLNNDGEGTTSGMSNYTLEIPLSTALVTFKVNNATQEQVINYAATLPLGQIVKMIQ